jgi:hypothetical protein
LPIPLAQFAALSMKEVPGYPVPPLASIQLGLNAPPVVLIINRVEQVEGLGDTAKLGNGTCQRGGAPAALQRLDQRGGMNRPHFERPGDPQGFIPVVGNQGAIDPVPLQAVQGAIIGGLVQPPETHF